MMKIIIAIILLASLAFCGCNSLKTSKIQPVSPDKAAGNTDTQGSYSNSSIDTIDLENIGTDIFQLTEQELWTLFENAGVVQTTEPVNLTPEPYQRPLRVFTDIGIESFYQLYKRVPMDFQEYIDSGIPMIIPNDEITGKTYHLVNNLDMNDTSGFTFTSDGVETCEFKIIIKGEEKKYNVSSDFWTSYKVIDGKPGPLAGNYEFDKSKREYIVKFFLEYAPHYSETHNGHAPEKIEDLFAGRGELIENGWKWTPEPGDVKEYVEIGFDTGRERWYHVMGSKGRNPGAPMPVWVYQLYGPDKLWDKKVYDDYDIPGIVHWEFTTANIRSDVIDRKPYFTSDQCYEIYKQITGKT